MQIPELRECNVCIGRHIWHLMPPRGKLTEDQKKRAPVVVLLSGAGGFGGDGAPRPLASVWYFWADISGKYTAPLPPSVPMALEELRLTTRRTKNRIILAGFSRGARWVDELILESAQLFDFAIAIAPYPRTKDQWNQREWAREVMQVNRPIMYIEFASDEYCNCLTYRHWFEQFELGMTNKPSSRPGCRRETFGFFMVAGVHQDGEKLFRTFDFSGLGDPQLTEFSEGAFAALGVGCHAFRDLA